VGPTTLEVAEHGRRIVTGVSDAVGVDIEQSCDTTALHEELPIVEVAMDRHGRIVTF
jgi:hypothetical protein